VGISLFDTVAVDHADVVSFSSYCGAARNRALLGWGLAITAGYLVLRFGNGNKQGTSA